MRKLRLEKDNYLYQNCYKNGVVTIADFVHHTKEIKTHWHLRLIIGNLISQCHDCHNKEHKKEKSKGPTLNERMTRGAFNFLRKTCKTVEWYLL